MKEGQKTRVGAIGGGQLAWMMALEAQALGIELIVQTPKSSDPAVSRASDVIFGAIADATTTKQLAQRCDAIAFGFAVESILLAIGINITFLIRLNNRDFAGRQTAWIYTKPLLRI